MLWSAVAVDDDAATPAVSPLNMPGGLRLLMMMMLLLLLLIMMMVLLISKEIY